MARPKLAAGSAGFSLLELLIALVFTGILSLAAYASLDLCIKAMGKGQQAGAEMQEVRVAQAILTRSVSSAAAIFVDQHRYFIGTSREMRFLTQVPLESHTLGGIYHWRIFSQTTKSGGVLLVVEQTRDLNWRRDPGGVEVRQILVENLAAINFSFGRGAEGHTSWDAQKADRLPDWVKITLAKKGVDPVVLMIPLYVAQNQVETQRQ